MLWFFSAFNLLLAGVRPGGPGIKTLLIIPVYFLLDWGLREVLRVVFGITTKPGDVRTTLASEASDNTGSAAEDSGAKAISQPDSDPAKEDTESKPLSAETEEPIIMRQEPGRPQKGAHRLKMVPTPKKPEYLSLAAPIEVNSKFADFGVGIPVGGLIGSFVNFIANPVTKTYQRLVGNDLPADGKDVCAMPIGPVNRPAKPPAGCK